MLRDFRHLGINRWTRVCLVVAAVSILAESRAEAGCGDHTFISFAAFTQEGSSSNSQPTRTQPNARPVGALPCGQCPSQQTPEPCRGPSCSGQNLPQGLPTTTTTTSYRESQSTAFVTLLAAFLPREGGEWFHANDNFEPIPSTDSIFHPPRA